MADGFTYHMEALRKQRIIDRKHDALENLARKQEALQKSSQETRESELESRAGTRAGTRAAMSRQASNQAATRPLRYRYVLPPKPEPLHQWYDLQNKHIHHEARALDRTYKTDRMNEKKKEFWERS